MIADHNLLSHSLWPEKGSVAETNNMCLLYNVTFKLGNNNKCTFCVRVWEIAADSDSYTVCWTHMAYV